MAGLDAVIEAEGIPILRVLPLRQEILLTQEVRLVIDHEDPALHPAGVAPAQVRGNL